ncbi:MAG: type II toxin-antitoxin system VapC family toxin [Pirellulales bacterium]|nr:type II toxin-antitoxin system VapC family toxin [Pirellulales bacterium]
MNDLVFVDTGAWFASLVPGDANHEAAVAWFRRNQSPLVTTDFVVDETLTLLRMRNQNHRALLLGERFFAGEVAALHFMTPEQIIAAWKIFQRYHDKNWSFTDCASNVAIDVLGCGRAISFDVHFRQFGKLSVEP